VSASTGATSISVAASSLNTNNRFSSSLSPGELVMIVQMQGATMNTSSQSSSTWGTITDYNSAGLFEFNEVASIPNTTTINLVYPLVYSYSASGAVQVIRVPRYNTLTINAGASLTTQPWNGSTGGIVAIEDSGATVINGTIDVSGLGFRGGKINEGTSSAGSSSTLFASYDSQNGGEKGEGICGSQALYDGVGGRYGRGAAGNGGGGGNAHHAGGGGGANAGTTSSWNGNGNPDTVTVSTWKTAWDLEGTNFHASASTGGGRGGYSWSKQAKNPLTTAPGNPGWQGSGRANVGGLGGRPLDNSGNRIFMGGGGGASCSAGSAGSNGGGIVYILSGGTISGTGTINANGNDATGGAGAGGTVILYTKGSTISNLSINAKGGKGGDQKDTGIEAKGPGGGGSGGFIGTTNATSLTTNVSAGKNGTTTSTGMTAFAPNGATCGSSGIAAQVQVNPYSGNINLPVKLKSFSGKLKKKTIALSWATATEINNDYFTVEKSANGNDFYLIGRVNGTGNSMMENSYAFVDDSPLRGNNFYRLSQTDYDGTTIRFTTIRVEAAFRSDDVSINTFGPAPFNEVLRINYNVKDYGLVEIQLLNANSQPVRSEQLVAGAGMNSFFFSDVADLKKGTYYLRVVQGGSKSESVRVVKI
jgi:hypothetical protein